MSGKNRDETQIIDIAFTIKKPAVGKIPTPESEKKS